jgi:hypothetical protein
MLLSMVIPHIHVAKRGSFIIVPSLIIMHIT